MKTKIALYLAGKLPPYYQSPFDKFELIELIRKHSTNGYTDDFFKLIDSHDFYSICLNRIKDKNEVNKILSKINIPKELWVKDYKNIIKVNINAVKLYLMGQFPHRHKTPNRLLFIDIMLEVDEHYFSNKLKILSSLSTDYNELVSTCLEKIKRSYPEKLIYVLKKLNVPKDVSYNEHLNILYQYQF